MENTRYSRQILMKLEFSQQIFKKYSNIKFNENLSCGSRDFQCERTDGRTQGQRDMTKLIDTYRNFSNAPQNLVLLLLPRP
jgi:hypothetical protein